jgi:hypothetical protein
MTLKTKLIRNGQYVTLFTDRTIFFGHEGRLLLQEHIGDFKKQQLLRPNIKIELLHRQIVDYFNYLLQNGLISFWRLPGFIFRIEKSRWFEFDRAPCAVLETIEVEPPIGIKFEYEMLKDWLVESV